MLRSEDLGLHIYVAHPRIAPRLSHPVLTQATALAIVSNSHELVTSDAVLSLSTERLHACLRGLGFMS